jgi:hypothetical protein
MTKGRATRNEILNAQRAIRARRGEEKTNG